MLTLSTQNIKKPKSLLDFLKRFKKQHFTLKGHLLNTEKNHNRWRRWLNFPKEESEEKFLEYFKDLIPPSIRLAIKDLDFYEYYKTNLHRLYHILNKERNKLLKQNQNTQPISQVMVNLVSIVGFGNPYFLSLLRSHDPWDNLNGVKKILKQRDILSFELGFKDFSSLSAYFKVNHIEDYTTLLTQIEQDIANSPYQEGVTKKSLRLRPLSIQEAPFRSCLSGDCSTYVYFEVALNPNFIYFTLTDNNHKSSGHITIVLGEAKNFFGKTVKTAFIDKIQNIPIKWIKLALMGAKKSLEELGYKLAIPTEVGWMNDLSIDPIISGYVESEILPHLTINSWLRNFTPHKNKQVIKNDGESEGFSRAYQGLDLREVDNILISKTRAEATIVPGEIHLPKLADKKLSIKDFYDDFIALKKSDNASDQIKYIRLLNTLMFSSVPRATITQGQNITLDFSYGSARDYLTSKIEDKNIAFEVRQEALFMRLKIEHVFRSNFDFNILDQWFSFFSISEQTHLSNTIKNWRQSNTEYRQAFFYKLKEYSKSLTEEQKQTLKSPNVFKHFW